MVGAKSVATGFKTARAFSTVTVAIGGSGPPDGVHVVALSQYARDQRLWEYIIRAEYEAKGYHIVTP